jgi:hypothetical protein
MYIKETLTIKITVLCVQTLNSTVCYKISKNGQRRMDELKGIRLHVFK